MAGIMLLVMGIIVIGAGIFAGNAIGSMMSTAPGMAQGALQSSQNIFTYVLVGIGALMSFFGLISLIRGGRSARMTQQVLANGVPGEGKITFVDRNYRLLVNNRPVYSIVEYVYSDGLGNQFMNRVNNANTEQVIRAGWQVGSSVPIKYLSEDPSKSAIVMG